VGAVLPAFRSLTRTRTHVVPNFDRVGCCSVVVWVRHCQTRKRCVSTTGRRRNRPHHRHPLERRRHHWAHCRSRRGQRPWSRRQGPWPQQHLMASPQASGLRHPFSTGALAPGALIDLQHTQWIAKREHFTPNPLCPIDRHVIYRTLGE
jgi:hypothetical protein